LRILASIFAVLALAAPLFADKAADIFRKGEKQEKSGHIVEAYLLYTEAAKLAPGNPLYRAKTALLKPLADKIQLKATPAPVVSPTTEIEPDFDSVTARELADAREALPPPHLKLTSGRFDFHFSGEAKDLFNQIAPRCGLQTIFDSEYDQQPLKVRFDLDDADCRNALHAAEAATSSFVAPISSKLILVSKDTPAKRVTNEPTMSVIVPVPTVLAVQDLTEIAQAVKQATGVDKLAWNAATGEIMLRDRVSRVLPAKALVEQLVAYRGSIIIELRFLELSNSDILSYGVNLTNTFNILYSGASATPTLAAIYNILTEGKMFAISAINASVVASLTQSSSRTLLQTQVRAVSGFPSTFHSGEKYPILTSEYVGGTSTATVGAYTPPPSFTYQDLGISLKITPTVGDDLVTMDIDSEYQLLGASSIDGIPILTNRKYTSRISLHHDEWALIGGLTDETRDNTISGVAGLARIPLLGWLFKTKNKETDRDHIIILMKPWLVGAPPGSEGSPAMAVGSETRPLSPI
jgi:hypothetical protein